MLAQLSCVFVIDATSDTMRLAEELDALIEEYRRIWLVRNRAGGLADSAGRLERLLALYRGE
ncbi:MAG: hypothetical protein Kow0077_19610 [Anaerolineae bacterium]